MQCASVLTNIMLLCSSGTLYQDSRQGIWDRDIETKPNALHPKSQIRPVHEFWSSLMLGKELWKGN